VTVVRGASTDVDGPIMVCGGAGFIGSHLVERLLADDRRVDVVDDLSSGSLANLADARNVGGDLRFHHLDVTSLEFAELVGLRQPRVIYHLAVLPPGSTEMDGILRSISILVAVMEAARRFAVEKVVLCLPAALVYGEVEVKHLPVKEGRTAANADVAQVVMRALIDLMTVYRELHAVEFSVLATSNVYGLRQRPQDGVVAAFASAIIRRQDAEIFGNGKQTRDFVYIDDAIDALARAMDRGGGLKINIGTGVQTSVEELWKRIAAGTGRRARKVESRHGEVQRLAVSPIRAKIQLGWTPWTSLDSGLSVFRDLFLRMPSELRDEH
jgi:UDP-glucose 4-epimerase